MIRKDVTGNLTNILSDNGAVLGGAVVTDATNVAAIRFATGHFDNVNYDATTYNRGFVNIWYTQ